jgi:DNA polymerase family B
MKRSRRAAARPPSLCHHRYHIVSMQVGTQPAMEAMPLVMEPESRFYADGPVVVLDFQSLYPSQIIAYNLCFRWRPTSHHCSCCAPAIAFHSHRRCRSTHNGDDTMSALWSRHDRCLSRAGDITHEKESVCPAAPASGGRRTPPPTQRIRTARRALGRCPWRCLTARSPAAWRPTSEHFRSHNNMVFIRLYIVICNIFQVSQKSNDK